MSKHKAKHNSLSSTDLESCQVLAVDLAKNVFQLAGEDEVGRLIYERRIKSREAFGEFLQRLSAHMTVLMETGPGAQSWA
jgi:transposase